MTDFRPDLRTLPSGFEIEPGFHGTPEEGMCALEAVSWIAGLPHSDQPSCVCETISALVRSMNDRMSHSQRQGLKPFLPRLVGSKDAALAKPRAKALAWRALNDFAPIPLVTAELWEPADALAQFSRHDLEGGKAALREAAAEVSEAAWGEAEANGARYWDISAEVSPAIWTSVEVMRLADIAVDQLLADAADSAALATTACQIIVTTCRFDPDVWPLAFEALGELLAIQRQDDVVVSLDDYRRLSNEAA